MDRREGEAGKNPVLTSEGQYEAKKLGIAKYLECSALKQEVTIPNYINFIFLIVINVA